MILKLFFIFSIIKNDKVIHFKKKKKKKGKIFFFCIIKKDLIYRDKLKSKILI